MTPTLILDLLQIALENTNTVIDVALGITALHSAFRASVERHDRRRDRRRNRRQGGRRDRRR